MSDYLQSKNVFQSAVIPNSFGKKASLNIANENFIMSADNDRVKNTNPEKPLDDAKKIIKFNQQRGIFISLYARYEYRICEILHALNSSGENIKIENSASLRLDKIRSFNPVNNNIKSLLGTIRPLFLKFKNYEVMRNIIAHGKVIALKEGDVDVFLLEAFSNNGQSRKMESKRLKLSELVQKCDDFNILIEEFENKSKAIIKKFSI